MSLPKSVDAQSRTVRLDAAIDLALSEKRIVGAVVFVAENGKIAYRRAAGLADREAGRAMQENAIFRLASITKPLVSAVVMRLVEQGVLDLDYPVTRWLPNFRPRLRDESSSPEILLRHLLTHTSGLSYRFLEAPEHIYHALNISDGLDQPGLAIDKNLERLALAPLSFSPGSTWRYSLGIDVIGEVVAIASGLSLPTLVQRYVTDPLEMRDTGFSVVDMERLVPAYFDGAGEPVRMNDGTWVPFYGSAAQFAPSRILDPRSYPSGGAGMAGTAEDILRFLETIRTGGGDILATATVDTMTSDQVGSQAETQGPGWGFGYGWAVLSNKSVAHTPQAAGTIQWGGAYGHYWFVDRENGLTAVSLTNTAFEGMSGAFPWQIRDAIYG
ncbi:beta-lactamase family protein [Mesorhizobium sp. CGMCC 1.15528]|uniref:Beta-lactamase family protein n=1 Tax=Mesorhizobium zhangyense TaxID=1776730 RepID=A0A7C9RBD1_9HYPH|nr:serine hydrolase domain-containing protein [Mesorhizobium zhangyense]NGN44655.1 beta-lactamase family protein [Mesorhizobium zhangyense]